MYKKLTKYEYKELIKDFTYGSELEVPDIDTRIPLPGKNKYNFEDYTICNNNGIGNDPKKKYYLFGSEINVTPTNSIKEQLKEIKSIHDLFKNTFEYNYTSNLHIHIMIPKLNKDIDMLKKLLNYIYKYQEWIYKNVDPVPHEKREDYESDEDYKLAREREKRRYRSHHTKVTEKQYNRMINATTPTEFYKGLFAKSKDGKINYASYRRLGINISQLFNETGTLEFRFFTCTKDLKLLENCFNFCEEFVIAALYTQESPMSILERRNFKFPKFHPFNPKINKIYKLTGQNYVSKKEVKENIKKLIKEGIISLEDTGLDSIDKLI